MPSKHKSKEAKPSKKEPWKERGKGKGKEKDPKKEKKQVISLSVAVYTPDYGNLHHWALYLDTHNYIYQVVGELINFTADVVANAIPSNSSRYVESIKVAEIHPDNVADDRIIRATLVQNDVQGWCCQDYVMEALGALNEDQVVVDEEYEKERRRLLEKFNH